MTNKLDDFWTLPTLSPEDQKIVDAYVQVGTPVDQLPYTEDFNKLMRKLNEAEASDERKYQVFQRLLQLRKKARLPRIAQPSEYY